MSRPAGRRRRGRELALRVLFELEGTAKDPRSTLAYQATEMGVPADAVAFAGRLVEGTLEHVARIDAAIGEASDNWDLVDFGKVERAVLRLGTFEVLFEPGDADRGEHRRVPGADPGLRRRRGGAARQRRARPDRPRAGVTWIGG